MNTSSTSSQDVLLATKVYIPPTRPDFVARPHLFTMLDEGVKQKLTLISAAAGFGKTTLLSTWITTRPLPVAWVSLDKSENDAALFWKYIVFALETLRVNIGQNVLPLLQVLQPPPIEAILTVLINALTAMPQNFVLILDDYHVIENAAIHSALSFLLEHMPPQMHIIIASRSEPNLPLPRLRARGQLTELHTLDLRFSRTEIAEFLAHVAKISLSQEQVQLLETRAEGWIAGIQLASLSLQRHNISNDLIATSMLRNHYVLDYLVEEVLERQPEQVQTFLLHTSILDRLNSSLCDSLTGQHNGQEMLEQLEEANLFLTSLNMQYSWYRYHPLFAKAMQQTLHKKYPDHVPILYQRASLWYEQHGFMTEAIDTALTGQQYERVAQLIGQIHAIMTSQGATATLVRWLQALPDTIVNAHSNICILYAWLLYISVQFDKAEQYITQAQVLLDHDKKLSDHRKGQALAEIAALRAVLAVSRQDTSHAIEFGQYALASLSQEKGTTRALVTWALGVAYWFNDNVEAASRAVTESIALSQRANSPYAVINGYSDLVQLQFAQGQLRQAERTCQQGLRFVRSYQHLFPSVNSMHIALGELQRERNNLEEAGRLLTRELKQEQKIWDIGNALRGYIALAQTRQAQGDARSAIETIHKAKQLVLQQNTSHLIAIILAYEARLWLMQDNVDEANRCVQESNLRADETLHHTHEVQFLTLARLYLAQQQSEEALHLLTRLLVMAEGAKRMGSVIEILVLSSLAQQQQANTTEAVALLTRALSLAQPEGYVRIFVDGSIPMVQLLNYLLKQHTDILGNTPLLGYMKQLIAAFPSGTYSPSYKRIETVQSLIEPLSERELEVLGLIANGASNRAIAEQLIVSLGTVKKHLNNIFGKLGVNSRTQAGARARELDLLV